MKLDVRIMGVKTRRALIAEIIASAGLDPSCIVFDDRGENGGGDCWYTAKKAWLAPLPEGTTHRLVLQDDVLVCDNFVQICDKIIEVFPEVAWNLYNGPWVRAEMKKTASPYINFRGCKCGGPAIILPVQHIKPMIEWSDGVYGDYLISVFHFVCFWLVQYFFLHKITSSKKKSNT